MKLSVLARVITLAFFIAVCGGCATSKTASRSEIELDVDRLQATGKLVIKSPKDVDLQDIRVTKRGSDYSVTIGHWRAVVSAAAIEGAKADAAARQEMNAELVGMVRLLAEKAAASQGVPMASGNPAVREASTGGRDGAVPVNVVLGPDGRRYKMLMRNGVVLIAPVDDEGTAENP
jgi:hypothetical protein